MKEDMALKIEHLIHLGGSLDEDRVRSLVVLVGKMIELMPNSDRKNFGILKLFRDWAVHIEIDRSRVGIETLAFINNTLVRLKSADTDTIILSLTEAIGFGKLRSELSAFLKYIRVDTEISEAIWKIFLNNLVEIIRDVPLSFPSNKNLNAPYKNIYRGIVENSIKPGAGVVSIALSEVDYEKIGTKNIGNIMCLQIRLEDTTTIIVP